MNLRTIAGILAVAVIQGIVGDLKNDDSRAGKALQKSKREQPIPTFFGSDGQVRKVSPSAILDEVKRCLPPGLLIPLGTVWPELPPNLKETEGIEQGVGDKNLKNAPEVMLFEEEGALDKKRVMRSNEAGNTKNISWETKEPSEMTPSMNVRLEGPQDGQDVVIHKDFNQKKLMDVLKEMISKHLDRKIKTDPTSKRDHVESKRQPRKFKTDEYEDYDYGEMDGERNPTYRENDEANYDHRNGANVIKSRRSGRKQSGRKRVRDSGKKATWRARHEYDEGGEKDTPSYDYVYDEEEDVDEKRSESVGQLHGGFKAWSVPRGELERKRYLKGFSRSNPALEKGFTKDLSIDKLIKQVARLRNNPPGESVDYKKLLNVVMTLNSKLVKVLEKTTQRKMHRPRTEEADQISTTPSTSPSVLWDFMDLLMRVKRGANVEVDSQKMSDPNTFQDMTQNGRAKSVEKTDVDLLNRLLKWYLDSTESRKQ